MTIEIKRSAQPGSGRNVKGSRLTAAVLRTSGPAAGRTVFPGKELVVFDLDGTLVDTMQTFADVAGRLMAESFGIRREEARRLYLQTSGLPFAEQLESIFPGHPENRTLVTAFEAQKVAAVKDVTLAPEDRRAVHLLADRGIRVAISSNNFQANVDRFVEQSGLRLAQALGFRLGFAKGADHFAYLMDAEGVTAGEMLFVGDSLADLEKARSFGVDFVGRVGTFRRRDFERMAPGVVTIRRLAQLDGIL
jgi:phosphoglycolate phosphatase-like HAD superfamily hydrolase